MLPTPYTFGVGIRQTSYIGYFISSVPLGIRTAQQAYNLGVAGSSGLGKGASIDIVPSTIYTLGHIDYPAVFLDWYNRWFTTLYTQKVYSWALIPERNPDFPDYNKFSNSTSPNDFFAMAFNFTISTDVTLSNGMKYNFYIYTDTIPLLVSNNWFALIS